jgi:S1-C subfamily serine protease
VEQFRSVADGPRGRIGRYPHGMARTLRLLRPLRHLVPPLLLVTLVWLIVARSCAGPAGLDPAAEPRPVQARGNLAEDEEATIELFRRSSGSVVHVVNLRVVPREESLTGDPLQLPQGTGTGFVWDEQGHVVTNAHVVAYGDEFVVILADRSQHRARLVGIAASYDIAVLHVDPKEATIAPLPLGRSGDLRVGQTVFAIGNPFGLDQTLTHGIVSGLGREVAAPNRLRTIYDVIQTDAAINPGNSGGPLLDSAGRVVGVNSQIASPSGASAGIGFAIPIDTVNHVVPELIRKGGYYVRPVLGVGLAPDWDPQARAAQGAVIRQVMAGTGAQRGGLRPGDVIVEVAGTAVRNRVDLFRALDRHAVGETVAVKVRRGSGSAQADVVLGGTDDTPDAGAPFEPR